MAKGNSSGGRGLKYKANLDVAQAIKNAKAFKKEMDALGISTSGSSGAFNTKPISGYQQALLKSQEMLRNARLETERLKQEQQSYRNQLEQGKVSQQTARTAIEQLKIAEQQLNNQLKQGKITQQDYNTQVAKGRVALQAQSAALNQSKIDTQNARTQLLQYNLQQKQLAEAARNARNSLRAASGSYQEAQERLKQLGNQIKSVAGGFNATGPIQQARIREYRELNERLKAFDATMGNHQRNVGNYKAAIAGIGSELASMASQYLSASFALQTLLTNTMEFQRIKTPLTYILGSEGAADAKLGELKQFANDLGVEFFTLAKTYKSFSAAARASNFDLNNSEKIFRSVTKASAVLGLSSDQLEGALLALQQMISKGNVQSEELRGQLGERLPGAFSLAAKAMNVTEKELGKLLQTGSVTANDLLPKLAVQLDKTYGDKAAGSISGLNAELGRLQTAIQSIDGSNLSKYLFEPIIQGATGVINFMKNQFRGSFSENIRYMFSIMNSTRRNLNTAYDLRDNLKNNTSILQSARTKDYKDSALGDLRTEISQLDAAYRKATSEYDKFRKGVNDGTLKESGSYTVKYYADIAKGLEAERDRAAKSFRELAKRQVSSAKDIADSALTAVSDIRKRITELQKLPGSAIDGSDIDKRIKALQARLKDPSQQSATQYATALKARNNMQRDIDALTKKGVDRQLAADEQELESVKAKYKKMRDAAIAFNNDPKNKAKGLRVDSGGLLDAESRETDAVRDKIASEKLKVSLDKQQEMYAAYEDARTKIGKDKAAQRYEGLIETEQTYLESLEAKRDAILNPQKSKGGSEIDVEANQLQMKVLNEAITKEKAVQQKKYDDLLSSIVTFEKERNALQEQYAVDRKRLEEKNDTEGLEQLTKNYNKRLAELGDNHLKEQEAFQKLYAGIENMSDKNAIAVLGNAEDALKALKSKGVVISKELEAELKLLFGETRKSLADRLPERIIALANQIDSVANSVSGVNEEFGKVLSTLGNVVGQVGNIKKGIVEYKTAMSTSDGLGAATAGLGIFGAGVSILSSLTKMFDKSAKREEQAAYARELQNKQTQALNKSLERQVALMNDAYGTDRINKYSEAIKQAQENEIKYQSQLAGRLMLTGNKLLDEQIAKYNNGEAQTGAMGYTFTQLLKKGGTFQELPSDIASLQALLDEGKLDASTATVLENLIKAKETAVELSNNLKADNIGSSLSEIADSFMSTLTDGSQNFGKGLEDTIRKSIINGFKQKLIQEQLQPFYNQFAELSEGGLTAAEITTLKDSYLASGEKATQMMKDLEAATGVNLSDKASGMQGAITSAGLTEDSANKAMGIWRGQFDQTKKIALTMGDVYKIATNQLQVAQEIAANTLRTADNTQGMGDKLDAIARNTAPSSGQGKSLEQQMRDSGLRL